MAESAGTGDGLTRAQFGTRIGFVLAAIGSAVGYGSISRFPMNVANNGGAMFVIMYLFCMVLVGIPLMLSEFSLGRTAQRNTVGVYKKLTGNPRTKWRLAGYFHFALAAFVLSWYAVVSGWTLRYVFASMTGSYFDDPGGYLGDIVQGPSAVFWMFLVLALTLATVIFQVSKGIEKVNMVLMPLLFAMVFGIMIYAAFLQGVGEGYVFYLRPDMSAFTLPVFTAAIGQAFFSLSLGVGAMMTYSSYLSRASSLAANAAMISLSTLFFAIMCGFMIFPLLAAFDMLEAAKGVAGLELIFGPMAATFATMPQPLGQIIGTTFFLAAFFAAFSSAISLTEPSIAYVAEEHGVDRRRAAILMVAIIYVAALASAYSVDLLNLLGGKMTDIMIISGGLAISIYVGWFSPGAVSRARMDECEKGLKLSWYVYPLARYVLPVLLTLLIFFAVFGSPCWLAGTSDAGQGVLTDFFRWRLLSPTSCAGDVAVS